MPKANSRRLVCNVSVFGTLDERWPARSEDGDQLERLGTFQLDQRLCDRFPALTALAATWNPALSGVYGKNFGEEARYREKDVMLGPG